MVKELDIPERIYRRVERRSGEIGYTVPRLTVMLYSFWLDGKIDLAKDRKTSMESSYTRGFGMLRNEIDKSAPHDMDSIRRNIASSRKAFSA